MCLTKVRPGLWLTAVDIDGELATLGDAHDAWQLRRYIEHEECGVVCMSQV